MHQYIEISHVNDSLRYETDKDLQFASLDLSALELVVNALRGVFQRLDALEASIAVIEERLNHLPTACSSQCEHCNHHNEPSDPR